MFKPPIGFVYGCIGQEGEVYGLGKMASAYEPQVGNISAPWKITLLQFMISQAKDISSNHWLKFYEETVIEPIVTCYYKIPADILSWLNKNSTVSLAS